MTTMATSAFKRKPVNPQAFQGGPKITTQLYQEPESLDEPDKAVTDLKAAQTWPQIDSPLDTELPPDSEESLANGLATLDVTSDQEVSIDQQFEVDGDPEALSPASATKRARFLSAIDTTTHYLGSLLPHPTVSTKHYTILRHSHGLVYYKGPETSLAITIFSDRPLPSDRRLWLQVKGWTGKAGMRAKAFFRSNSSWINVTPEREVEADNLDSRDERAWQRDIRKFMDRPKKVTLNHVCRETCVVRIPFEAIDGYFRVVMTTSDSRNVLCPSPTFRVASTSMSASSVKGASLSTLPIELAVKVAQFSGKVAAQHAGAAPLSAMKQQVVSAIPGAQDLGYIQTAAGMAGVHPFQDIDRGQSKKSQKRDDRGGIVDKYEALPREDLVGDETGPMAPFPLKLKSRVVKGSGKATKEFGMPTANLDDIPHDLIAPVKPGIYFGWALVTPKDKSEDDDHADWRQAIITIAMGHSEKILIAQRKVVRAYLIHDYPPDLDFVGAKLELVVMGWLRPLLPKDDVELILTETVRDVEITQASLEREAWGPEDTLRKMKTTSSLGSVATRVRSAGQRHVNRVPVHKFGVRNDSLGSYDRGLYGNGGVFVRRD